MKKLQKFTLVILVQLLLNPIFSQTDNQVQTFRWSHYVGIDKYVIHHESLAWFKTLKRDFRIELIIVSTSNYIIYGNGKILIPRYGSDKLIPATFNLPTPSAKKYRLTSDIVTRILQTYFKLDYLRSLLINS